MTRTIYAIKRFLIDGILISNVKSVSQCWSPQWPDRMDFEWMETSGKTHKVMVGDWSTSAGKLTLLSEGREYVLEIEGVTT